MSERIEGKVVLITGGGTGLGAETARHLASKGAIVAIAARRRNKLDEVVAQITGAGGRASAYLLDVADKKQFKGVVDVVIADFGRLDVLINNAGLMPIRPMAEVNTDEWDALRCSHQAARSTRAPSLRYGRSRKVCARKSDRRSA